MKAAIFVNQTRHVRYADAIVQGYKPIETRTKDVLHQFVGQRVLIVRTQAGKPAAIVGAVTITRKAFCNVSQLDAMRNSTLIPPGSKFDAKDRGKWCYYLGDAARVEKPVLLSDCTVSHRTRSFCLISDWEA